MALSRLKRELRVWNSSHPTPRVCQATPISAQIIHYPWQRAYILWKTWTARQPLAELQLFSTRISGISKKLSKLAGKWSHISVNGHCLVEIKVSTSNAENVVKISRIDWIVYQLCDYTDFRALFLKTINHGERVVYAESVTYIPHTRCLFWMAIVGRRVGYIVQVDLGQCYLSGLLRHVPEPVIKCSQYIHLNEWFMCCHLWLVYSQRACIHCLIFFLLMLQDSQQKHFTNVHRYACFMLYFSA